MLKTYRDLQSCVQGVCRRVREPLSVQSSRSGKLWIWRSWSVSSQCEYVIGVWTWVRIFRGSVVISVLECYECVQLVELDVLGMLLSM